jgi:Protein of unknown function DUF262
MTTYAMTGLYEGEQLTLDFGAGSPVVPHDRSSINAKYVKGEVRIITEQARYPLPSVVGMYEDGKSYVLNPDFQRRHRWNRQKQSRLIESFIMNVPIPPIFLYEVEYSKYEVMDGLQRMTAIYEFYRDRFPLTELEEWRELNGLRYSELPEQVQKGIDRRYLSSIILLQETAKSPHEAQRLKQLVFERINSGGVQLEPQESRNAIYDGPLNRLCIQLARNPYLCRMWGIPEPTTIELETGVFAEELLENETFRRMEDVELVLRFFAYRQRLLHDQTALNVYLDEFLSRGNNFSAQLLGKYKELFQDTVKLVFDVLGEDAFRLWRQRKSGWNWFDRPTKVVYEPMMYAFSQQIERKAELLARAEQIRAALPEFYQTNYAIFEGRKVNRVDMNARNGAMIALLNSVLPARP